jgi:hypothetical protein
LSEFAWHRVPRHPVVFDEAAHERLLGAH